MVGCVVRVVLWFMNRRRYFLCCFSLMLVEMDGLNVGGCLFGMVTCANSFLFLQLDVLRKMVGINLVMDMVVEVVVLEAADVAGAGLSFFFQAWLFGEYDGCDIGESANMADG